MALPLAVRTARDIAYVPGGRPSSGIKAEKSVPVCPAGAAVVIAGIGLITMPPDITEKDGVCRQRPLRALEPQHERRQRRTPVLVARHISRQTQRAGHSCHRARRPDPQHDRPLRQIEAFVDRDRSSFTAQSRGRHANFSLPRSQDARVRIKGQYEQRQDVVPSIARRVLHGGREQHTRTAGWGRGNGHDERPQRELIERLAGREVGSQAICWIRALRRGGLRDISLPRADSQLRPAGYEQPYVAELAVRLERIRRKSEDIEMLGARHQLMCGVDDKCAIDVTGSTGGN